MDWGTYAATILPNGRLLGGQSANTILSVTGLSTRWWFRGDTGNWVPEADYLTTNDVIEFPDEIIAYMPYMLCAVMAAEFSAQLTQEVSLGALEGRQVLARTYGRRGRAGAEPPIGLPQAAAPAAAE
jgi:hypothetical protein